MKPTRLKLAIIAALATTPLAASAAGLEYSKQSILPFFEEGNYAEVSYAYVDPKIEATDQQGNKIDDMMDSFSLPGAAVRLTPNDEVAMAIIYEKPWGVDTVYPSGNMFTNSMAATEARLGTDAVTTLVGGKFNDNWWLYGGFEYQKITGKVRGAQPVGRTSALSEVLKDPLVKAQGIKSMDDYKNLVELNAKGQASASQKGALTLINQAVQQVAAAPTLYSLDFEDNTAIVPVVGLAYEIPEIMLRAALTYRSPAKYRVSGQENLQVILPAIGGGDGVTPKPVAEGLPYKGSVDIEFPQSVNLDFQTGLSEKYQLLGMVNARWVNWSNFDVSPPVAMEATKEPLAAYQEDSYAVEVALGKQITDGLAGEVRVGYDTGTGQPLSLLGPYNAVTSLAMGGQYDITDALSIGAGAQYMWFEGGNVNTVNDGTIATAEDGTGYAVGMKVGYHF